MGGVSPLGPGGERSPADGPGWASGVLCEVSRYSNPNYLVVAQIIRSIAHMS